MDDNKQRLSDFYFYHFSIWESIIHRRIFNNGKISPIFAMIALGWKSCPSPRWYFQMRITNRSITVQRICFRWRILLKKIQRTMRSIEILRQCVRLCSYLYWKARRSCSILMTEASAITLRRYRTRQPRFCWLCYRLYPGRSYNLQNQSYSLHTKFLMKIIDILRRDPPPDTDLCLIDAAIEFALQTVQQYNWVLHTILVNIQTYCKYSEKPHSSVASNKTVWRNTDIG